MRLVDAGNACCGRETRTEGAARSDGHRFCLERFESSGLGRAGPPIEHDVGPWYPPGCRVRSPAASREGAGPHWLGCRVARGGGRLVSSAPFEMHGPPQVVRAGRVCVCACVCACCVCLREWTLVWSVCAMGGVRGEWCGDRGAYRLARAWRRAGDVHGGPGSSARCGRAGSETGRGARSRWWVSGGIRAEGNSWPAGSWRSPSYSGPAYGNNLPCLRPGHLAPPLGCARYHLDCRWACGWCGRVRGVRLRCVCRGVPPPGPPVSPPCV